MSNVNQIMISSLLRSINQSNINNSSSLNTNSDSFDNILKNTLGNLSGMNSGCSCSNNNSNMLGMLNTIVGTININKIDTQQISNSTTNNENKTSSKIDNAINLLEKQVGKPYVWGASGPDSFDCSGLVKYIYKTELGKDIPRTSYDQSKFGQAIEKKDLQPGDLVFFDTMSKGRVSHVGMYIGNNEFIHASNARDGVKKSKLSGYYEKTYQGARRP